MTPVSDPAFYALSHGSKHFVFHGSSNNRLFQRFWLAVEEFWPIRKRLKKVPCRAQPRLPCERAWKAWPETGVKSDLAFCLGSLIEKTNSVGIWTRYIVAGFWTEFNWIHLQLLWFETDWNGIELNWFWCELNWFEFELHWMELHLSALKRIQI